MNRRGRGESGDVRQTKSAGPTRTGGSGDAAEYALEREAEDVAAVVESIDEPVVLLGHSCGGIRSPEAALRTDDLRKRVLYEPGLPVSDPDSEAVLDGMEALVDAARTSGHSSWSSARSAVRPPRELDAYRSAPDWPARMDAVHTVVRVERARKGYEFDPARFAGSTTPTLL